MNEYPDMKFFNCTTIDDVLKVDIENFGEVVKEPLKNSSE